MFFDTNLPVAIRQLRHGGLPHVGGPTLSYLLAGILCWGLLVLIGINLPAAIRQLRHGGRPHVGGTPSLNRLAKPGLMFKRDLLDELDILV